MRWMNLRGGRIAGVVALPALLGVSAWAWNSEPLNLRDRLFPKHLAEVEPGWLYRSGQIAPNLIESTLRDLGIDVIVDLTVRRGGAADEAQAAELRAAEALDIEVLNFPLGGSGTGEIDQYVGAVAAIARAEREGKQVLVHCGAGDRRTGGVIAAYQLLVEGEPPHLVREEMERFNRRPGSDSRLIRYLDENLHEIGARLTEAGVIRSVPDPLPRLGSS